MRVLAVGGLAGAAWLLIGAAAQAADRTDGPDGALLGSIVGADADSPITGLPQVADQPLENPGPAHHERDLAGDILDAVVPVQHGEVSSSPRGRHRYPAQWVRDPVEGGSAAILPDAIANHTMARHQPAIALDVEARRQDAEAPTVSPD
ncbi:MAG TPA: hypothetical protein VFG35_12340 [Actinoplanes sp.]|nr:hypothetical protein [Actinoplanes sp.]